MRRTSRFTRSLVSLTVLAGACSTSATSETAPTAAQLPSAPPVRALQQIEPVILNDGLHRIVVTVPAGSGEISPIENQDDVPDIDDDSADEASVDEPQSASEANSGTWNLTPEQVSEIPDGATLAASDGVLGYRTSDGTFVPLDSPTEAPTQASPIETSGDVHSSDRTDLAAWLASIDGVQDVSRITDTTYAVTTSALEPLEEQGVEIAPDAPFALTADPYEPYQWSLENDGVSLSGIPSISPPNQTSDADVDGLEARSAATGRGVIVAVIDSGVDFDHRDLAGSAWVNPGEDCGRRQGNGVDDDANGFIDDCNGWDFGLDDRTRFVAGSSDHGTHVAGIIAANAGNSLGVSGMAPDARIMDLKVDDDRGAISASAIARSIRYAVDNGADVVNLSLGSQPGAPIESVAAIAEAVTYAGQNGVLLVAAAGNNGQSLDSAPVYPASFNAAHMLVVAASSPSDTVASFSNTGSPVDLMAPGELVLSTVSGDELAFMSGTSQAAPMVAAAAAQVLEGRRDASPSVVIEQLITSADDVDPDASQPPRLNSARALGLEADAEAGGTVAIRNLMADDAGRVEAEVVFPPVEGQFNQPFHWEVSLVSLIDGAPFAITDHPVATGNDNQMVEHATNGRGAVTLAGDDAQSAAISTDLPPGVYAVMIEAIPRTDSTVRLGDAFIAVFTVGNVTHDIPSDETVDGTGDSESDPGAADDPSDVKADETDQPTGDGEGDATPPSTDTTPPPSTEPPELDDDTGTNGAPTGDAGDSTTPPNAGSSTTTPTTGPDTSVPADGGDQVEDPADEGDAPTTTISSDDGDDRSTPTSSQPVTESSTGSSVEDDTAAASDGPIEIGPDVATDGQWSVTDMTPQTGPIDEETLVRITGSFPEEATVWFGGQPAETVISNDRLLVVRTPRHAEPETVDVSLRTRANDEVLKLSDGFAFLRPGDDRPVVQTGGDSEPAVTSETTPGSPESDPASGEDPGFELDPGEAVIDAPEPAVESGGRPDKADDNRKSRNRQARSEITGPATRLPNGLSGVPLSGLDLIGGVPACNEPLCRTRRI